MKKPGIPLEEQEKAAKHFTLSNLAMLEISQTRDIDQHLMIADRTLRSEMGVSIERELQYWRQETRKSKPGDYLASAWVSVKSRWD